MSCYIAILSFIKVLQGQSQNIAVSEQHYFLKATLAF